jgi:hypothetical protein
MAGQANAASRHIGRKAFPTYLKGMTDAARKTSKGPAQIHAPLQAWFTNKAGEPAPEHLVALADELEVMARSLAKAG